VLPVEWILEKVPWFKKLGSTGLQNLLLFIVVMHHVVFLSGLLFFYDTLDNLFSFLHRYVTKFVYILCKIKFQFHLKYVTVSFVKNAYCLLHLTKPHGMQSSIFLCLSKAGINWDGCSTKCF